MSHLQDNCPAQRHSPLNYTHSIIHTYHHDEPGLAQVTAKFIEVISENYLGGRNQFATTKRHKRRSLQVATDRHTDSELQRWMTML